jgi:hypothetical protein
MIFEELKLIMSRCAEKPSRLAQCCSAALHRKSLREKALASKIALDAVPHASHSIGLVWWRRDPRCRSDFASAGAVSRAEFARTTASRSRIDSRMRGYPDHFRRMSPQRCFASDDCAGGCRTTFKDSNGDSALGGIAVS